MSLEILTIPCRTDNYAYLLKDQTSGVVALVDAPEAQPILEVLDAQGWQLDMVLITHHHGDHVEGLAGLLERFDAKVVGAAADAHRLPKLDQTVAEGDDIAVGESHARIIDVSGHTIGHIAYYFPQSAAAFTADSLMALGCGRVFEGTMPQMWTSLSKLAALPPETMIYSGHEYTSSNAKFALTIEPENADLRARVAEISEKRAKSKPTVPSRLSVELATNPFLRAGQGSIKNSLGMEGATDAEAFAEIRTRKDNF